MTDRIEWGRFPEYDAFISARRAEGDSYGAIAAAFYNAFGVDVTGEAVESRVRRVAGAQPDAAEALSAEERLALKVAAERSKTEDRALAREMAAAVKTRANWEEFLDIVRGELVRTPRSEAVQQLVIPAGSGTPETMVVLVGDIHIGKLVDPAVVGEGFGYGIPIFEQRMARLKDRIVRLYTLHSATAPIEKLVVYMLGDGVDGTDMRRGHAHRVDVQTATQQTLILTYAFEDAIRSLSASLGIPIVVVWEFGNHGRVGDFGVNLPADNWDYIAGQMLGIALRDMVEDGAVTLHADSLLYSVTKLGPYVVYSSHNANIKGGDGFSGLPINGMARGAAKDSGLHQRLWDLYLMAHFHTPQDVQTQLGRIIMNGAWDGGDDYSVNGIKAASDPVQWAFGIHPEKGMTWQSRINLAPGGQRRQPTPAVEL